jgi:hypothetical protein
MCPNRQVKYQVFISSTFKDLIKERQAVVKAILETQNIPAGMELFTAGDETQLDIIKRWISESDIYMLILGGRYGTLEPESQLSYTEVEYRYALELKKPMFALVLDEAGLKNKQKRKGVGDAVETNYSEKYQAFRKLVMSKICAPFSNPDQAQTKTILSLHHIIDDPKIGISGWIRNYPYQATSFGIEITAPETDDQVESTFEVSGTFKIYPEIVPCYVVEYNPQLDNYWPKSKITFHKKTSDWSVSIFIGHGDGHERIIHVLATGPAGESVIQKFFENGELDGFKNLTEDMITIYSRRIILKKTRSS